ncbi:MAG: glucosamine kinase [Sphingobacteriales bacterium]|jgi:glucosamine kinase
MIVIADSGSTKTDWRLVSDPSHVKSIKTVGFNPFFVSTQEMIDELMPKLGEYTQAVDEVYFYGAGCSSLERNEIIELALAKIFPKAYIQVNHDLLAAARGVCGNEPGLVAILGTGSNACVFDGTEIISQTRSLGYLLGDEGSGAYFGKQLITDFLNKELPSDVLHAFTQKFKPDPNDILNKIYKEEKPNRYFASFSTFFKDIINTAYAQRVMTQGFNLFLERHILKFKGHHTMPLNFVGSIGFHFHQFLKEAVDKQELNLNYIIQTPIENLVVYHLNNPH